MPYLRLDDGNRIFYMDEGPRDGNVLLLIHGWCATSRLWSEQIGPLTKEGYRVIAIDSCGHGRSTKTCVDPSFKGMFERLEEFLEKLHLLDTPIVVFGHSAGGGVAQFLARKFPDKVRALVLLQTGYRMRDGSLRYLFWSYGPMYAEVVFHPTTKMLMAPALLAVSDGIALALGKKRTLVRQWVRDIFRTPPEVAAQEIREILSMDIEYQLDKVKQPVCVIGSRFDTLVAPYQTEMMGKKFPDAEAHLLNLSGHGGKISEADRVNSIVIRFLRKNFPAKPLLIDELRGKILVRAAMAEIAEEQKKAGRAGAKPKTAAKKAIKKKAVKSKKPAAVK